MINVLKEKRVLKVLMLGLVVCGMMLISGIKVNAQTVTEIEPNNTKEEAQLIEATYETPAKVVSGDRSGQYVVKGTTSTIDEEFFKVYLNAGTQYITCNDSSFDFEVYDSNDNYVFSRSYIKTGLGVKAYEFTAPSTGYYYVKVKGITSSPSNYILAVGGPTYGVQNCTVSMNNVTMSGSNVVKKFNLKQQSNLPNGAIVYTMSMSNVSSTAVNGISVKNMESGSTVELPLYTWNSTGLVSRNMPVKSDWNVTFKYKRNITISPRLNLYYTYPITSEEAGQVSLSI